MELTVEGKIKQILPVESGTSKAGKDWKKLNFILESKDGEHTNTTSFDIFGEDKVDNFVKFNKVGDNVTVHFNLSSREHNGRWYTQASAWMVKKLDSQVNDNEDDLPY
jgi:hypothetical protein